MQESFLFKNKIVLEFLQSQHDFDFFEVAYRWVIGGHIDIFKYLFNLKISFCLKISEKKICLRMI
jgi:hypothetical protein